MEKQSFMKPFNKFIWETHGIHAGTEQDHIKHGIDRLEDVVDKAIEQKHPSILLSYIRPASPISGIQQKEKQI